MVLFFHPMATSAFIGERPELTQKYSVNRSFHAQKSTFSWTIFRVTKYFIHKPSQWILEKTDKYDADNFINDLTAAPLMDTNNQFLSFDDKLVVYKKMFEELDALHEEGQQLDSRFDILRGIRNRLLLHAKSF